MLYRLSQRLICIDRSIHRPMQLPSPLQTATLKRRYKRFLADVETAAGQSLTLHCPNTGSMKNCQQPGSRVWYTMSDNPKRKYPGTWHIVEVEGQHLVGINTSLANNLVAEAIEARRVPALKAYDTLRREVAYGEQRRSRIDLLLNSSQPGNPPCYVEIKNVSLGESDGTGLFPDAITKRGQKHLTDLMEEAGRGNRALLFFCVQHSGIECVRPADAIDPDYGRLLREAAAAGVGMLAFSANFDLEGGKITLARQLPVQL